jgi:hypothetical protein
LSATVVNVGQISADVDSQFLYAHYQNAELGYAVTDYVAQDSTVHTGLAVITGTEDPSYRGWGCRRYCG